MPTIVFTVCTDLPPLYSRWRIPKDLQLNVGILVLVCYSIGQYQPSGETTYSYEEGWDEGGQGGGGETKGRTGGEEGVW